MQKEYYNYTYKLIAAILFAAAMGYLEAAIVVYLREVYYPEGFAFPLKVLVWRIFIVEIAREFATIIMLASVGYLIGQRFWERFGWFIILWGIWDIFYYVWLKVTINWPSSLFDWDILFLIPSPWIGPVIAPVLVSLLMVVIGISITHLFTAGYDFHPTKPTWLLAIIATVLILSSFIKENTIWGRGYMPEPYKYWLLIIGLFLYSVAYLYSYKQTKKNWNEKTFDSENSV